MALRPPSNPDHNPTTAPAPGPDPDPRHHVPAPTPHHGDAQLQEEKGRCRDCCPCHHSPSPSPLRECDAAAEEWEEHAGGEKEEDGWGTPSPSREKWEEHAGVEKEEDGWGARASSPSSSPRPRNNASRRHPRKAELFRRLGTSCEAARVREGQAELLHPPPRPSKPENQGSDVLDWPPNTASWRRFCYLRAMESNPINHVLDPTENALPHQPSKKSRKMVPAKDDDQCYDAEDSSQKVANGIVLYENDQGENHCSPAPSKRRGLNIGAYVVQCNKCLKWRFIPSKKKYEEIREKIIHVHFMCEHTNEWKPEVTCHDPTDISKDDNRIWAIDKPGISQPPPGWERIITIRNEGSIRFADVYYIPPAGKTLRSTVDVAKYLEQNPQYAAGVHLSQFSFKIPAPLRQDYVRKWIPQSKLIQPEQALALVSVPPIHDFASVLLALACVSPIHEDFAHNMLVPCKEADPTSNMSHGQLLGDSSNIKLG